ncbi:hypothetical protein [Anaerovibrio sp. RM50]|uniref:hypothetical protein n=1 Tax=Anaerovibrio sp. RM50 TaxID=1200557 RepID=UPI00047F7C6D|nr:hypothetical protein [Anaerovibrio sp. RM50]
MKKNLLLVSLFVVVCLLCTACSLSREKADVGIKNLATAMLQLDSKVLSKYDDSINVEEDFLNSFVPSFQRSSGDLLTKEQATKIGKEMIAKLAQIEVKSSTIVSEKDDEADVKITFDKFNSDVLVTEPNAEESKKLQGAVGSKAALQEALTDIFVNRLQSAPKSGTAEITAKCKYNKEKKVWMPTDMEKFAEDLYSKAWEITE